MIQSGNKYDDPAGCRPALSEARAALRPIGRAEQGTWCAFAVALGRCRLFGVEPGDELDGTLTVTQARTAAAELDRELTSCATRAETLGKRWDFTSDPDEALELVCSVLEDRMDAWAGLVALDEAYEAGLADGVAGLESLAADLEQVMDALDRFDQSLEGQLALLSLADATPLLNNWRAWLAPEFAEERPWWLDGRLETAARKVEAIASAVSSSSVQLARVREQIAADAELRTVLRSDSESPDASADWAWWPANLVLAADTPQPDAVFYSDWHSPLKEYTATVAVSASGTEGVQVLFFRRGASAVDLVGQQVELAGVPGEIKAQATASFSLDDLRRARMAGQRDVLRVDGVEWLRTIEGNAT